MASESQKRKFDQHLVKYRVDLINAMTGRSSTTTTSVPITWGECQDREASRLKVRSRDERIYRTPPERPALWRGAEHQIIRRLTRRTQSDRQAWNSTDYRQCFQINDRAFRPKVNAPSILWDYKAESGVASMTQRSRKYLYSHQRTRRITWQKAAALALQRMSFGAVSRARFLGSETNPWTLCLRFNDRINDDYFHGAFVRLYGSTKSQGGIKVW